MDGGRLELLGRLVSTVFDGLARSYTIARAAVTAGTDAHGNPIPATPEVSFRASLSVITGGRASALVERHGADPQVTYLIGECLDPATIPEDVGVGFTTTLTWGDRAGTLTIIEVIVDPLGDILDEIVGQAFYARFRT